MEMTFHPKRETPFLVWVQLANQPLVYGQSITDACLGWSDSESLLTDIAAAVASRRNALPRTPEY